MQLAVNNFRDGCNMSVTLAVNLVLSVPTRNTQCPATKEQWMRALS